MASSRETNRQIGVIYNDIDELKQLQEDLSAKNIGRASSHGTVSKASWRTM